MVASVSKFSVEHEGHWLPVLYIFQDEIKKGPAGLSYCCEGPEGVQIFLQADRISKVQQDPGNSAPA